MSVAACREIGTEEYEAAFRDYREAALEKALDIRKFEIELYWKRATYFWAFITTAMAGYFTAFAAEIDSYELPILALIASLGLFFSYGWFLVNKGSKFWQQNWEKHVDMLEDKAIGPLYKTVFHDEAVGAGQGHFREFLVGAQRFSVSKVNQIISFYVFLAWIFIYLFTGTAVAQQYDGVIYSIFSAVDIVLLCIMHEFSKSSNRTVSARITRRDSHTEE